MEKVILTGFVRSGTTSMAEFFSAFGVPVYHQHKDPGFEIMEPYNIFYPPEVVGLYLDKKAAQLSEGGGFEASGGLAHFMYGLAMRRPDIKWIIMIRHPARACASLRAYNRKGASLRDLAMLYDETYISLIRQCLAMPEKQRPRWMDFEKYIRGGYIRALFDYFNIQWSDANKKIAQEQLAKKVRSSYPYEIEVPTAWIGPKNRVASIFANGLLLGQTLKQFLKEVGS